MTDNEQLNELLMLLNERRCLKEFSNNELKVLMRDTFERAVGSK